MTHLLRAGTVSVSDLAASVRLYEQWLDYRIIEDRPVDAALAAAWGAPAEAGSTSAVLQPASGAKIYLRLVETPPVAGFRPLVTYGWAALEFCVQDVLAVHERLKDSPFEIVGPPRKIEGLDAIHPMQARGLDGEICYFTQINSDLPHYRLPRASTLIDHLFIHVLAASDMAATQRWLVQHLGLGIGSERMEIVYTMLAKAFGAPLEQRYEISTMVHERDVFLEVDQMPPAAGPRPRRPGRLPPGVAMTTLAVPDLDAISAPFVTPATRPASKLYHGQPSATVIGPDGALIELVQRDEPLSN